MSDPLVEARALHDLYHDSSLCPQRECYLADLVALVERAVRERDLITQFHKCQEETCTEHCDALMAALARAEKAEALHEAHCAGQCAKEIG